VLIARQKWKYELACHIRRFMRSVWPNIKFSFKWRPFHLFSFYNHSNNLLSVLNQFK